ncbi:MAG: hypothetical protein EI684_19470 [Candidatus Viridilinea halotolerans]|uniref:Uncharacterized protein n=1 Tax=Candidatus Viridilinea halotolerans TaxID=2491704 RepID=A0A426TSP1_9CHLR|nr:MAG: hypothetical protein EI684_19470 [Candidatus Viridilinea halotolerans]
MDKKINESSDERSLTTEESHITQESKVKKLETKEGAPPEFPIEGHLVEKKESKTEPDLT